MSAVDPSRPDTIARRAQCRTHRGHTAAVPAGGGIPPCGDTLVWTAARVEVVLPPWTPRAAAWVHCRSRWACRDGRPPATAMSLPCSLEPWPCPRRMVAVRPASRRNPGRPADTAAVSGSAGRAWVPGQVGAAGGHRRSKMCDRGRGLRPPATRGRAGTVDTRDCGRGTRTLRQRPAGQPATEPSTAAWMSGRERDRKVRHRPAPPWPDRQIRSLGTAGKPASSWQGSAGWESRPLR